MTNTLIFMTTTRINTPEYNKELKHYGKYIKNQLIKLCDNPEWFNDMLNTWDFKPERESQAIKEYLSHVLLNGKLENTHTELRN